MPRELKPGEPRYYRKKAGYTLDEVEEVTGIAATSLSRIEAGNSKNPRIKTLWQLAELYSKKLRVLPGGVFLAMAAHLYELQQQPITKRTKKQ